MRHNASRRLSVVLLAALLIPSPSWGKSYRDPKVRQAFMKERPCPSTGKRKGRCDGYQVDHRWPLCYFGVDAVWNMQWLSVKEHREKTKLDIKVCSWDGK